MSEDLDPGRPEQRNGTSRRTALKAGVGIGVGLVAWSGPTITSLGGTPAYAQGCTFVVRVNISGGCRNTDNGCSPFGYHSLVTGGLPPGYTISAPIAEGTCCTVGHVSTLTFPAGITCIATIRFAAPPLCTGGTFTTLPYGPSSNGSLAIGFVCPQISIPSNAQYTIVVTCNTTGAPLDCLQ